MNLYLNEDWNIITCNGKEKVYPKDWVKNNILSNLSSIGKIKGGKAFLAKNFANTGYGKVIKIKNVGFGNVRYDNLSYISKEESDKSTDFLLRPDDIIISMTGSSFNAPNSLVGRVAIVKEDDINCYINQRVGILKFTVPVSKKFWFYFMSLKENQHFLVKHASGSANQVNISNDLIESLNIPSISLDEQEAISVILSSQENIVNNTKKIIQALENRNNFLAENLLSGNLRIKEENGTRIIYKNLDKNWKIELLNNEDIEIPNDWNKTNIKNQSTVYKNKFKAGLQYLEIGDINILTKKYDILNKEKISAAAMKFVPEKTLVISTVRPTRLAFTITKEDLNVSSAFVRLNSNIQDYLYFILYTKNYFKFIDSNQAGATYPTIKEDILINFEFALPNKEEIEYISDILLKFHLEKEKYIEILHEEEKTFSFLLEELMSGRLRVKY